MEEMTEQDKNNQHYLDTGIAEGKRRLNGYWVFMGFVFGFMTAMLILVFGIIK